jgi:hypothetical protein
MEKMYVLSFSRGSWDDYHRINIGVFESKEKADAVGDKFLARVKELNETIETECPIDEITRIKYEEECDFEVFEALSVEEQDSYHLWWHKKHQITEINMEYQVDEFDLNKANMEDFEGVIID